MVERPLMKQQRLNHVPEETSNKHHLELKGWKHSKPECSNLYPQRLLVYGRATVCHQ